MSLSFIKRIPYRLLPVTVVVEWPAISLSTAADPVPVLRSYLRACHRLGDWLAANGYDKNHPLPRSQLPRSMQHGLCMFTKVVRPFPSAFSSGGDYVRLLRTISQEMGGKGLCSHIGRKYGPTPQRRECVRLMLEFLVPLRRSGLLKSLLDMEPHLAIQILDENDLERARLAIECWNRGTLLDREENPS